jgi:hypothetical protein
MEERRPCTPAAVRNACGYPKGSSSITGGNLLSSTRHYTGVVDAGPRVNTSSSVPGRGQYQNQSENRRGHPCGRASVVIAAW